MKRRSDQKTDKGRPRARKGALSDEDQALWEFMARGLDPVRRKKPRIPVVAPDPDEVRPRADLPMESETKLIPDAHRRASDGLAAKQSRASRAIPPVSERPAKPVPPLAQFERKRQRRIASGRMTIEARLDLHGSRQAEAYHQFRGFLLDCAARGYSTVLVVTGKGGTRQARDDDLASPYATTDRGVLRRSVPLWLEQPDIRALVASYTSAAIQHGGDGALYIHLRKRSGRG